MEIFVTLNGQFPRSENLIRATRDFDRGRTSLTELEKAFTEDYNSVKELQKNFKWVSDGLLYWQDILRPFADVVEGTRIGGLVRYYETNTFIRRLYFSTAKIKEDNKWVETYFRFGNLAILPGPFTFKKYTYGFSLPQILDVLTVVVKMLVESGFSVFYFQEPEVVYESIGNFPENYKMFFSHIKRESGASTIVLNTYFGSVVPIIKQLLNLEIDGIGVDFFETDVLALRECGWDKNKGIIAGVVNTTNSLMESIEMVEPLINVLTDDIKPGFLVLTGRADFELLPRRIAENKVNFLKRLVGER